MSDTPKLARISSDARFAAAAIVDGAAHLLEPWRTGDPRSVPFLPLPALADAGRHGVVPAGAFGFLPPIAAATKIICLGINYRDHAEEVGEAPPANPALFVKLADALVGHRQSIVRPRVSDAYDFEGEIAVVIGKGGRHIAPQDAMRHVYGFTALMDGSVRDYQQHSPSAGKCFHASGAIGPWIVPAAAIVDVSAMTLSTHVNGALVQSTAVDRMIYDIPTAIAYVSRWTPLSPGDVISTGTPSGVGAMRTPPLWLKAGDMVEVTVSGVGTLGNSVVDER